MERRKTNFLQKLYSREIHGSFFGERLAMHNKAINLFGGSIPERLIFLLKDTLGSRSDHILVGTTRCGQFLITYSYTTVVNNLIQIQYKYRLHWWAFRGAPPAHKVAEVQLFDCQDIAHPLHVGIAQWPNVNDKLIVYGYSDENGCPFTDDAALDSTVADRHYYITVTTLPSLHNCRDCKAVAESFDEEDMAANWDIAISFSCLRHGLTIHTTLDMIPPYPTFNPVTSLKIDNKIIINTGNFLHVLSFGRDKELKTSTERDTIVPGEVSHRIGEMLMDTLNDYKCPWKKSGNTSNLGVIHRKTLPKSINNAWHNTIMDKANKVYAFEESEDGCEKRFKWFKKRRLADKMYEFCSDDEDMENKCPPPKIPRLEGQIFFTGKSSQIFFRGRSDQCGMSSKQGVPNFSVCDNELSNKCDRTMNSNERSDSLKIVLQPNPVDSDSEIDVWDPRSVNEDRWSVDNHFKSYRNTTPNTSVTPACEGLPVSSTSENKAMPSKSDQSDHSIPPLDISVINPDLSAILAEWEADSVSSLSPRSDSLSKNDVIQSFLELIPGMTLSPRSSATSSSTGTGENVSQKANDGAHGAAKLSSPNPSSAKYSPLLVVLRTRNCNQDKELQKTKDQEDRTKAYSKEEITSKVAAKTTKELDTSLRQRMISGCSVRFDRIYIELDDEILSTISSDFEEYIADDDQGAGFHCALPLSVHGSAYAQLQMVPKQKAEKMNMDCERMFQTSFDIEQFCFKAADIICQCEGFKFWFCSDYDVELIDICTLNADILGVVCMRVNAEKIRPKNALRSREHQRLFYGVKCVFLWNPVADRCWLEAYSPLVETRQVVRPCEAPARREGDRLRNHLRNQSLFTLRAPIRTYEHRMWTDEELGPSIDELRDYKNLIGFKLFKIPSCRKRGSACHKAEFWD